MLRARQSLPSMCSRNGILPAGALPVLFRPPTTSKGSRRLGTDGVPIACP